MTTSKKAVLLTALFGSHLFLWWGLAPTLDVDSSFVGVRAPRQIWVLSWLLIGFAVVVWRVNLWAALLLILAIISGAHAVLWVGRPFVFIYHDLFLVAALTGWFVYGRRLDHRVVAYCIVGLAMFNVAWAGVQFFGLDFIWHQIRPQEIRWNWRFSGWLDNNTNLAHFLAMSIPLAAVANIWLVFPLMIPLILSTKTIPMIGAMIGMMAARRWWKSGPVLIAVLGVFIFAYDKQSFLKDQVRWTVIKDSLWISSLSPIFGLGPGSFKQIFPAYLEKYPHGLGDVSVRDPETNVHVTQKRMPTGNEVYHHPSNEVVRSMFEVGWPSLAVILGWTIFMFKKSLRAKKNVWRDAYMGSSLAFAVTMFGYQPTAVPPLIISGLLVWGIFERMLADAN